MASRQADSRRKYSWWWDSHISPKNSRWLQENLTDMDVKVKQMIKLIEEDADSFARRAEMYYKKRPELMKLVEEFYRAYRALAERYDHATGALRQAQRTMSEAFPNQMPFMMADDSPAGSTPDGDPRTPDLPSIRAFIDPDELQKDGLGISPSHSSGVKGFKQFNDMFGSGEVNHAKFAEGRARKGLNFHDSEEKGGHRNGSHDYRARIPSDSERVSKAELEIVTLRNVLSKIEAEKEAGLLQYRESLERLSNLESEVSRAKEDSKGLHERASKAEAEVQTLKDDLKKIEIEKEASFLQYQLCLDKISNLEKHSERADKAETEAHSLKQDFDRLEAEKVASLLQYQQGLETISNLEEKLLHAEEEARKFSELCSNAEQEVEALKLALAKVTEEKEAAAAQYQQCLEIIAGLKHQLACAQEEAQRLSSKIDDGVLKLKGAEEKCVLLERSNETMHSELETFTQKVAAQNEELTEKQKELGRLWTCVQEERLRFVEAETAFQTLQHLHAQSQDELRSMAAQLQNRSQILEDMEAHNKSLQAEFEHAKLENKGLTEVNLSSGLTIQNLHEEISSLKETIRKLEGEVELRVDERNALQQEIYCLKEELNDLSKKHQSIIGQVESIGFKPDCIESSVKGLRNENAMLIEVSEKERIEKVVLLEKLETMEKLLEQKSLLENSLSDLNVELDGAREKVKALEESCESLLGEKSTLVCEKATLASELQLSTDNLEKLTVKNNSLESSLLDANDELDDVRLKLKSLEDLCLLLENEKSDLATVKGSLISQLETTQKGLDDLGRSYMQLEENYFILEKEKESALHEVVKLQSCLDAEKQEHATLAELSEAQLAGMTSQILLLQAEGQFRKKEYEEELDRALNAQIDIFILQKCIQELEQNNLSLFTEYNKLSEASKYSEKLISELKHEKCEQLVEAKSLFDQIKFLRMGLYQVLETLSIRANQCRDEADKDEKILNRVLNKLEEMQELILKMQDENHELVIEKSILVTLLGQLQIEVNNIVTTKNSLDQELRVRFEQILILQSDCQKSKEVNEDLRLKIMEGQDRERALKAELKNSETKLSGLEGTYQNLYQQNCKVLGEQRSLVKSQSALEAEKSNLEEESCAAFAESVSHSTLCLILRNIVSEKSLEIKSLTENLNDLHHDNNGHVEKVKLLEDEKTELQKLLEDLNCKYDEVLLIQAAQEKKITDLSADFCQKSKEVECTHELNRKLEYNLHKLHGEVLEIRSSEENLNHELQKVRAEVTLWESQATEFFGELQMCAVRDSLFEGKLQELNKVCESLEDGNCLKEMEIDQLKERVSAVEGRNAKLNAQMIAYGPALISLRDSVTSLENHALSDANCREVEENKVKDAALPLNAESRVSLSQESNAEVPDGFVAFEELQMRIRAIESAVIEKEKLATLESLSVNSKLEEAMRQIEEMACRNIMANKDRRFRKQTYEISENNEAMAKDIMLDQVSECSSYRFSRRETMDIDDPGLEIWQTGSRNGSIDLTVGKGQMGAGDRKHNRTNSSTEALIVRDVGVDKLEISKRLSSSRQEVNERKILERLDSDKQKLTNLQITVQDLKKKVDSTEKSNKGKGIEHDNVKEKLEESEEVIMKLFDVNRRLMKNAEDYMISDDNSASVADENISARRRKITEQARRVSEKIGRLQLQVQKFQFILLKLDDENKNRGKTRTTETQTRVLLRDYIYGGTRRNQTQNQKKKKRHLCSCVQPPTSSD